jgi:hypothetical protein
VHCLPIARDPARSALAWQGPAASPCRGRRPCFVPPQRAPDLPPPLSPPPLAPAPQYQLKAFDPNTNYIPGVRVYVLDLWALTSAAVLALRNKGTTAAPIYAVCYVRAAFGLCARPLCHEEPAS